MSSTKQKTFKQILNSEYLENLAQKHYENFPVAQFVKKSIRPDVQKLYAFARVADDFADEPEYAEHALSHLKQWRHELNTAIAQTTNNTWFVSFAQMLQKTQLPVQHLFDLLDAFDMDAGSTVHESWQSLIDYANLSANPVGRCMLHLHGFKSENHAGLYGKSDALCTALQLTNFWQDVQQDAQRNRFYVPVQNLRSVGLSHHDFLKSDNIAKTCKVLLGLCQKTESLFLQSNGMWKALPFPFSLQIKLTYLGGMFILKKSMLHFSAGKVVRYKLSKLDKLALFFKALVM